MHRIREILRQKWDLQRTHREIAASVGCSVGAVCKVVESVAVRLRGAVTPTSFVFDLDYNARGQRQRCVHGNGTVTTYEYDPRTFRLARLRLVREGDGAVLQDLRYTYDPSGNVMQIRDGAQQARFFANAVVSGDQRFEYSAVYRLVRATGREHASLGQPVDQDFAFGPQPHPDDPAALREYTQEYQWDVVGNLLRVEHGAAGGSYTRQYAYATGGNHLLRNTAPGEAAEPFSHSYSYDEHGNMTAMPHLAAMAWDHADRLQHADLGGGGDVWFVYDAAGERVRKVQVNVSGSVVRERVLDNAALDRHHRSHAAALRRRSGRP
jgi:YD repeat-containing protein